MNGEKTSLSNSIAGLKEKRIKLEKKIDDILNQKGDGSLKHIKALAGVLNVIKDEYMIEEDRLKIVTQAANDKPVGKIVAFFTKQLYLNLYVVYSIKYINTINSQFTPEFKQNFIRNIEKMREIEIMRMNDPKATQKGEKGQDLQRIGEGIQFPSVRRNEAGLEDKNENGKKGSANDFDKKERIAIIIEMLKTYDIPYDNNAGEKTLLLTLKDGFALITSFIIESINSGPKNLEMLKNLQKVSGDLT